MLPFRITGGRGFHLTFDNGFTVSVQFGPGNYADMPGGRDQDFDNVRNIFIEKGIWEATTAEVAVWPTSGDMLRIHEHDTVVGWVSVNKVGKLISLVESLQENQADATSKIRSLLEIK